MNTIRTATLTLGLLTSLALAEPFSYQGQLQDEGAPANGSYDLVLQLYDESGGAGTQIGDSFIINDLVITDGAIEAQPDFGPGAFDGSPRYLAVFVRDGDSEGSYTPLLPRTKINPTPEAQYARVAGTVMNPTWTDTNTGIMFGTGLDSVLINRTEPIFPSQRFGVHSTNPGLVGMIISGPAGASPYYGYAENELLYEYTYHDSASNEWRLNKNGTALSVNTSKDLTVANNLNAKQAIAEDFLYPAPKTHHYSVSGNGFVSGSLSNFYAAFTTGGAYINFRTDGWLVAPVNLPDNAIITKMTAYCADTAVGLMNITLYGNDHGDNFSNIMASVTTSGLSGDSLMLVTDAITDPTVTNADKHYYLRVYSSAWPGDDSRRIKSVVIEYTTTQPD
jgi:hypothetical protein